MIIDERKAMEDKVWAIIQQLNRDEQECAYETLYHMGYRIGHTLALIQRPEDRRPVEVEAELKKVYERSDCMAAKFAEKFGLEGTASCACGCHIQGDYTGGVNVHPVHCSVCWNGLEPISKA